MNNDKEIQTNEMDDKMHTKCTAETCHSVLISSLKTEFSEALVKDHEGDAQLILELLHEHHIGNSQYSRAEINRITTYLTNIKLDDTWRGTNESFLMHYNDQLLLLDSLVL